MVASSMIVSWWALVEYLVSLPTFWSLKTIAFKSLCCLRLQKRDWLWPISLAGLFLLQGRSLSNALYRLSQETVETEEEELEKDRDAKGIARCKTCTKCHCLCCWGVMFVVKLLSWRLLHEVHYWLYKVLALMGIIFVGNPSLYYQRHSSWALSAAILFCGLTYTKVANKLAKYANA